MTSVSGWLYQPGESRRQAASLHTVGDALSLRVEGREVVPLTPRDRVRVSDRLGDTPRFLAFPDGSKFETDDNATIDALMPDPVVGLIHRLETHWRGIAAALLVVVAVIFATVRFGIPLLAEQIAFTLPQSVNDELGAGVLAALDRELFQPTTLDAATRARLTQQFGALAAAVAPDQPIEVVFRDAADTLGPNALALPSGTVVFTDQLVTLAEDERQVVAVFAHELGHLVRRHGLRQGIQASTLTLLMVSVFGDVSSVSSLTGSLPLMLTQLGYSRAFEREADAFAVAALERQGIEPEHFAAILERLEQAVRCGDKGPDCEPEQQGELVGYLSTHPATAERVRRIRAGA